MGLEQRTGCQGFDNILFNVTFCPLFFLLQIFLVPKDGGYAFYKELERLIFFASFFLFISRLLSDFSDAYGNRPTWWNDHHLYPKHLFLFLFLVVYNSYSVAHSNSRPR
ncbi:hypothetical protein J3459_006546 [Metarhizium acridum]|uniref:uncharacterized protein n=1 Tax=Metarhizium acridum TaxID=92637 RepID=UPI001C6AF675|nr:hypothetical protein J3458_005063 [Metarhizium acridum]KAG8427583.1 hypothetical protein J3459_006546 [Metarhizium acridum]